MLLLNDVFIFSQDAALVHTGCILSLPGSDTQKWHSDGDHLDDAVQVGWCGWVV